MLFLIKKSLQQVDFFVPDEYAFAAEYAPVEKASKFIPKWFKECPSSQIDHPTVKGCVGVVSQLTTGFIVPMWCDLKIDWDNKGYKWQYSDLLSVCHEHGNNQIPGFCDNYNVIKIKSPWVATFKKETNVISVPPVYQIGFDVPYKMTPGCQTSISKYNIISTHNFLYLERKEQHQSVIVKHQQPLTHLIPLNDYEYKINCHVDTDKWNKYYSILSRAITFTRKGINQKLLDNKRKTTSERLQIHQRLVQLGTSCVGTSDPHAP